MRYSFRNLVTPVAITILAQAWVPAIGQQVKPTRPGSTPPTNGTQRTQPAAGQQASPETKPNRPPGNTVPASGKTGENPSRTAQVVPVAGRGPERELQLEPQVLPPALEKILRDWEIKSSQITSLHGSHTRTVYNLVFEEERIAKGKFFLQTPDKGRIDLVGEKPKPDAKAARLGAAGKPFKIVPDRSEKWICTGDEIVMVDDEQKTFQVIPLPEDAKGKNIINTPLPFLFGMKADDAKRRFRIELSKEDKDTAVLIIHPKLESDLQNYTKAFVILDKTNYLPTAVKLFDPTAQMETVYKFESVKINDTGIRTRISEALGWRDKDIFRPDLKGQGYKLVLPPAAETAPQKNSGQVPSNQTQQAPVPSPRPIKR